MKYTHLRPNVGIIGEYEGAYITNCDNIVQVYNSKEQLSAVIYLDKGDSITQVKE